MEGCLDILSSHSWNNIHGMLLKNLQAVLLLSYFVGHPVSDRAEETFALITGCPINMGIQWRIRNRLFLKILWFIIVHYCVLSKTRKLQYINRVNNCPSSLFILRRHYRHIFTAIYRFHKITLADIIIVFSTKLWKNTDTVWLKYISR